MLKTLNKLYTIFFISIFLIFSSQCSSENKKESEKNSKQTDSISSLEIEFEKFTLANGLDVIFHVDKTLPVVHSNIWYHVGSKNDPQNIQGFAHLFEHMMFQGTKNIPYEFLDSLNKIGASDSNATTSVDRTNYYTTVPSENLENILWLEADRMGFMADYLDNKQFANQKDVVTNEKKESENHPYSEIKTTILEHLFPINHPYHHAVIGDMQQLRNSTLEDVKEFYELYYSPNNATLALAGNFDPKQTKEWIQKYFGPLKPGKQFTKIKKWLPTLTSSQKIEIEKDVPLEVMIWVWPGPYKFHEDAMPLDFATSILADGGSSRLYKKLVHEEQLATEIAFVNSTDEIAGYAYFLAFLRPDAKKEKVEKIVNDIFNQFALIGPSENEVQRIKSEFEYGFVSNLESLKGKAQLLSSLNTYLDDPNYYKTYFANSQKIKAADVKKAFQNWIHKKNNLFISYNKQNNLTSTKETIDRKQTPKSSDKFSFQPPNVEKTVLTNGLEIYVVHEKNLPKVLVSLNIKSGNLAETKEKSGTGYFTAEAVGRGTDDISFVELSEEFGKYGASFFTSGSKYNSHASLSTLKKHLDKTFSLYAKIILNPAFREDEIDRLKKTRSDYIDYDLSRSSATAQKIFYQKIFGENHPAGLDAEGTKESLEKITQDDLKKEYETFWIPNNSYLAFVGDITLQEAKTLAEKHFSSWVKKETDVMKMKYLIYDIESVVDKKLLKSVLYSAEDLTEQKAYERHVQEQIEKTGSSFPNAVFHMPISLAVVAVASDFSLLKVGLLGHDEKTSRSITDHFWELYNHNPNLTFVDFNGSGYDMRLMELWAFREGIAISPQHFQKFGARYRFSADKHLDLQDALNNNGSIRYMGGLNLLAKLLGKPGKMDTQGDMVQSLYDEGQMTQIEDYCLGDTLDTYFVFLRWMVVQGQLSLDKEKDLVQDAFEKVKVYAQKTGYLKKYLEYCGY